MDKFLEKYNLPNLNQKEIDKLNRPNQITNIQSVIKKLPTKVQDHTALQGNSPKHIELIPILLKLFKKLKRREHSQIHYGRPQLPRYQNQTKTHTHTQNYRLISRMKVDEKSILAN